MNRITLERRQVWIYLVAVLLGLLLGTFVSWLIPFLEQLLWPTIGALLYVTFVQIPLTHLREAFGDRRFIAAVLLGNFVLLPLLVWLLVTLSVNDPMVKLGVLLVLLVPCTDWFITFCQLGGGDVSRAISVTPANLLLQLLLLPGYLWLMLNHAPAELLNPAEIWPALLLVGIPLSASLVSERWFESRPERGIWRERLAWLPVPLVALTIGLIAAAQVQVVLQSLFVLPLLVPVFVIFLLLAGALAKVLANLYRLPISQGRTLAFSLGTRNSFVVLPFALALPSGGEVAAVVIVVQSLVELLGMIFFVWWIPNWLFRQSEE